MKTPIATIVRFTNWSLYGHQLRMPLMTSLDAPYSRNTTVSYTFSYPDSPLVKTPILP